jgi:hypothetical protein
MADLIYQRLKCRDCKSEYTWNGTKLDLVDVVTLGIIAKKNTVCKCLAISLQIALQINLQYDMYTNTIMTAVGKKFEPDPQFEDITPELGKVLYEVSDRN